MRASVAEEAMSNEVPIDLESLQRIPVFPLPGLVLLPGGLLPLHFFEPRYRELARDCLATHVRCMVIANIALDAGEVRVPELMPRACVGRVIEHHQNGDGTYDVLLEGVMRVSIEDVDSPHAYRLVRAVPLRDRVPEQGLPANDCETARSLVRDIASMAARRSTGFQVIAQDSDPPGLWVDRLAYQFVADRAALQELLETLDAGARLDALVHHLLDVRSRLQAASGAKRDLD
jgi:Lon protease-like protein